MFINEYNSIEDSRDWTTATNMHLDKLGKVRNKGLIAIRLEGHFHTPNIPYMRASLVTLAAAIICPYGTQRWMPIKAQIR